MRDKNNGKQCKVVKNNNFTTMSNIHLRDKTLSLKAKGLMSLCLSLPDNWDYSIAGLVMLSSDGRDSVTKALNDLKKAGFLFVEKRRNEKGNFTTYYTFYENPEENPNHQSFIRDGFSDTVNPIRENRYGFTDTVNPQQINTNNKELKTNTNKQLSLVKTETSVLTCEDLFNLYKSICINFSQPRELDEKRKKQATKRLEKRPQKEFWLKVFQNAEKSKFMRSSSFFTFDWVIKNDNNPLKVYEGNYNRVEISESQVQSESKYSKCYG